MGGGAWPFLVGGAICLVNSDNALGVEFFNNLIHEVKFVNIQYNNAKTVVMTVFIGVLH